MKHIACVCLGCLLVFSPGVRAQSKEQIQALVRQLQDKDESIRLKAAKELSNLGAKAWDALPALKTASSDSDPDVRDMAEKAVQRIVKDANSPNSSKNPKIEPLLQDLRNRKNSVRIEALEGLAKLGDEGKVAGRDVVAMLLDGTPAVREKAAETLEKINPQVHRPVIALLVDKNTSKRVAAIRAIAQMGKEGEPAMPVLGVLYQQLVGKPSLRATNAGSFATGIPGRGGRGGRGGAGMGGGFGGPSQADGGQGQIVREDAGSVLRAMASVAPDEKPVGRAVLNAISAGDTGLRSVGLELAEGMKLETNSLVSSLIPALNDEQCRVQVVQLLGKVGPDAKKAVPILKKLRLDSSEAVRDAVTKALEKIEAK